VTCTNCHSGGTGPAPVPVHVTSTDVTLSSPAPSPRRTPRRLTGYTRVCTSATPVQDLVPLDENRLYIEVQAVDQDVVICTDISQSQDPVNVTTGLANPNGILLPKANTVPTRIEGAGRMWVTAAVYPARVSVYLVHPEG
jgi:hypothetical protein